MRLISATIECIRDYRRSGYGDGCGQVGNDYILISVATGIIVGLEMGGR